MLQFSDEKKRRYSGVKFGFPLIVLEDDVVSSDLELVLKCIESSKEEVPRTSQYGLIRICL